MGLVLWGVAPGCSFMPVRFPLNRDDDFEATAFEYIGNYADVISCSWGPVPVLAPLNQKLYNTLHTLATEGGPRKKGCVIVFAAGNYNAPINDPNNTSFFWELSGTVRETAGQILNGYATHPDLISVAASTSLNKKAAYSNWGEEISVCAPSNNFAPLPEPPIETQGYSIWTTDNEGIGPGTDFTPGDRFTGRFGGTSSATPLVAGVAALVISANPFLTAVQVKNILQQTADKLQDSNNDPYLGINKGIPNAQGFCEWFGYGKVNAASAVAKAKEMAAPETIEELKLDNVSDGSLANTNDSKIFKVTISEKIRLVLEGPVNSDFDVYLKKDAVPTISNYDVRGFTNSSNENIEIDSQPGDYYIMVRSYRGSGDFKIKVES